MSAALMTGLTEGSDEGTRMNGGKRALRISLERKYINAEGPSVLVSPSGISSCVPSKIGRIWLARYRDLMMWCR